MATFFGRDPGEVVFTSGGTESANLAVLGVAETTLRERGEAVVLCSAVEHPAVRESAKAAAKAGVDVRELPVDERGVLDPEALARTLSSRTTLVAVMTANNETGVIEPVAQVVEAVRGAPRRLVCSPMPSRPHPSSTWPRSRPARTSCRVSAHKVGGPVGTGALGVSPGVALGARQHGGGQERERRSGTQDVAGAVGLATALRLAAAERDAATTRVAALRDRLCDGLLGVTEGAHRTVPAGVAVLPGHLHLCVPGVEREELLVALGAEGVCASGGSSCASGALEPSHVLAAMGVAPGLAAGAVRLTLGYGTTDADVDRALAVVPAVVAALRRRA